MITEYKRLVTIYFLNGEKLVIHRAANPMVINDTLEIETEYKSYTFNYQGIAGYANEPMGRNHKIKKNEEPLYPPLDEGRFLG